LETVVMSPPERRRLLGASLAVVVVAGAIERSLGRLWWCKCGSWVPWSWDVWSTHNSQHVIDWYSFSHVQHGLLFYALFRIVLGKRAAGARAFAAVVVETAWEVLENSPIIIDRYRAVTASLDYYGDSVINSMADIGSCMFGYWLATKLPAWMSITLLVVLEVVMVICIRDSLLLNILMLTFPSDAIRAWQVPG
jgi:hypothetical protein